MLSIQVAWKAQIVRTATLANPVIYVQKMVSCLMAVLGTFVGQATGKWQSLQLQKSQCVAAENANGIVQVCCVNIDPFSNRQLSLSLSLSLSVMIYSPVEGWRVSAE
jgi:hypothetical protein